MPPPHIAIAHRRRSMPRASCRQSVLLMVVSRVPLESPWSPLSFGTSVRAWVACSWRGSAPRLASAGEEQERKVGEPRKAARHGRCLCQIPQHPRVWHRAGRAFPKSADTPVAPPLSTAWSNRKRRQSRARQEHQRAEHKTRKVRRRRGGFLRLGQEQGTCRSRTDICSRTIRGRWGREQLAWCQQVLQLAIAAA